MPQWQVLFSVLREHDVEVSTRKMPRPVAGGSISAAWTVNTANEAVFLKTGPASSYAAFAAEAEGLRALADANVMRVPAVLACVKSATEAMLALEYLALEPPTEAAEASLGARLANLHRSRVAQFGWHIDNTIGSTPQRNAWSDDWLAFYLEHRLQFQLQLAEKNGYGGNLQLEGHRLLNNLGQFFSGYWPDASLLHGDLWGGNWAVCAGEPVLFDPAVYYGDRETDIAMTKLFGGFGPAFYEAYNDAWPLSDGHERRCLLYQLYHVLNHLNLFGASYLARSEALLQQLN